MTMKIEIDLMENLIHAREMATDQAVVFSHVQKIQPISVLDLYKKTEMEYKGKRFYWENPDESLKFVGIDVAYRLSFPEVNENRFEMVESFWNEFSKRIHLVGENRNGTGPICFGGFSFYPEMSKHEWKEFGTFLFYIPSFLVTNVNGEAYLSSTVLITKDTRDEELRSFVEQSDQLFSLLEKTVEVPYVQDITLTDPKEWADIVESALEEIDKGLMEKIVLARKTEIQFEQNISISSVMENLSNQQKNSYLYAIENKDQVFIGASPERLVLKNDEDVFTACVAGTIGRGKTLEEDAQLETELLQDQKNIKEHKFVVDYIHSILEDKCSDLIIPEEPQILKNKNVQHLYTPVEGKANSGRTILDFIKDLHPTPAMGGKPHQYALEKIKELEGFERGFYASPIGWMDRFGNGEFIVGIRSALISENKATLYAGCGIVADSEAKLEYEETAMKFKPMLAALGVK